MFFILYLVILAVMYVITFKENFTEEKIQKVAPALTIVGVLALILFILSSVI